MISPGFASGDIGQMTRCHPASLILLWLALLMALATRSGALLILTSMILTLCALLKAGMPLRRLLRRSRWLLLTLCAVFIWMTPGTPLLLLPGASREGLHLAIEHGARLLLALASLALVLQALTAVELVAGMHALLSPLRWLGISPDRMAVRLMLTLEAVESIRDETASLRQPAKAPTDSLSLPQVQAGVADAVAGLASLALLASLWLP